MGSLTILLMKKLKVQLEISVSKINTAVRQPLNRNLSNFFTVTYFLYYKLDENIFKMLIKRNIPTSDPNKK